MPINMSTIKLWGHNHSGHGILIIVARPLLLEEQAHPLPVSVPQILLHPSALCFAHAGTVHFPTGFRIYIRSRGMNLIDFTLF